MQRQSLGSPVTKLHTNGGADTLSSSDNKLLFKDLPSSSLTPDADDLDHKSIKPRRFSSSSTSSLSSILSSPAPAPEKLIHLIPFLTLFCFLVLFLVSHNPSQAGTNKSKSVALLLIFLNYLPLFSWPVCRRFGAV